MEIEARMIIEVMGRPANHVTEALQTIVKKIESEKGISIINVKYHNPIPVKEAENLFTSFIEVDFKATSLTYCFSLMFTYLPSNLEIISPENVTIQNEEFNFLSGNILARLHQYDAIAKRMLADRDTLISKVKELRAAMVKHGVTLPESDPFKEKEKPKKKKKSKA